MASIFSQLGIPKTRWQKSAAKAARDITQDKTWQFGAESTTVAALTTGVGRRAAKARSLIYEQWGKMEADGICSSALRLSVTAALGGHETSGQMIFIEKTPEAEKNTQQANIVEEINNDLADLFNKIAFTVAYTGSAFGDAYGRVYADETGVVDVYIDEMVRPPLVQPFEQGSKTIGYAVYTGKRNFERLDITQMVRLKMPRTQWVPQNGVVEKSLILAIAEDDVTALPVLPSMAGGSLLYNAEEAFENLTSSIKGLVGQRWIDSIDESMLTVNMSNMTKDQQKMYLDSVVKMLTKSKALHEQAVTGGQPIMEKIRHIIPVFNEKQLLQINTDGQQSGRKGTLEVEDVIFHARFLAGALGHDLSMLGFSDQLSGGFGEGASFRLSAQSAEQSRVIRSSLASFFNQIIDIHTMRRYGVVFPANSRPWNINFYGSISALEQEKQQTKGQYMNSALMAVQAMQAFKDLGADENMMKSFISQQLKMDEDEAKLYAAIVKSEEESPGGFPG